MSLHDQEKKDVEDTAIYYSLDKSIALEKGPSLEPNNGRTVYQARIFIHGEDLTQKFFNTAPYLNSMLEHYQMNAPDGSHVFIPAEGSSFLIRVSDLKKISLPFVSLSTLTFLGNSFRDPYTLSVDYTDFIFEISLRDYTIIQRQKKSHSVVLE